ncbi:MAG: LysE family transporter [Bacteroidetes bacterium]|nr:LysE family transporter [Bacteroidota bacterium]
MALLYLFIGFAAAVIAAVPPGAANIVVVNTTINGTLRKALFVVLGAGIGEVLLSLIALHCAMNFSDYFKDNPWVQITIFVLFISIGTFFLLRNTFNIKSKNRREKKIKTPKFLTGFLLAFLNPPVLIFWVLAFTIIHKYVLKVSDMSPLLTLLLFFTGVYLGKVLTLYFYGKWGKKLEKNKDESSSKKDIFVGIALVLVGVLQGIRFIIA